jgi:hypothetical protein
MSARLTVIDRPCSAGLLGGGWRCVWQPAGDDGGLVVPGGWVLVEDFEGHGVILPAVCEGFEVRLSDGCARSISNVSFGGAR